MATHPAIYTIQAPDAPQHTGKLLEILQNLETEHRISGFTVMRPDDDLSSITDHLGKEDLILIVLTRQLEEHKTQIENRFKALKVRHPEAKIAEILVDNVVYANEFITFPADLRPIRDRQDMDSAWNNIEESLKNMFPAIEKEKKDPVLPPEKSNYMKIAGIIIGLLLVVFVIVWVIDRNNSRTDPRIIEPIPIEEVPEMSQEPAEESAEPAQEQLERAVPVEQDR